MERRKFVIGLGALVAGSGAALGTGASVSSTMDRDANIDVVNDATGLLALSPGTEADSDVVRETSGGELTIDFTANGNAGGTNVNSKYQVGSLQGGYNNIAVFDKVGGGPTTNNAFTVVNNDTVARDITVEYEADGPLNPDGSYLFINARPFTDALVDDSEPGQAITIENGNTTDSFSYRDMTGSGGDNHAVDSGGGFGVSILVDTTRSGATTNEDLSGTLTISSE